MGKLETPNGDQYIGQFKNGRQHGRGCLAYAGGARYIGNFVDGTMQGLVVFECADGDRYEENSWTEFTAVSADVKCSRPVVISDWVVVVDAAIGVQLIRCERSRHEIAHAF